MNLTEMRVADLAGPALAYAVAVAEGQVGLTWCFSEDGSFFNIWTDDHGCYRPDEDWEIGGPLIASNQVYLEPPHDVHRAFLNEKTGRVSGIWQTYESWHATVSARVRTLPPKHEGFPGLVGRGEGETPLIAACRAIVTSHRGETVSVPAELVQAVKP